MNMLEPPSRVDSAAVSRTGEPKKNVPGHLLAIGIAIALLCLSIGAALSGEGEPASLMLGMGIGILFGSGVVALCVRRAGASSAAEAAIASRRPSE